MEIQTRSEAEQEIVQRKNDLVSQAERCEVTGSASAEAASDLGKILLTVRQRADADRRSLVDPLNQVVKDINARYKPVLDALQRGRELVQGKLTTWQREEQRKAEEQALAEAEERRQAAEEAARQAAEAAKANATDPEEAATQARAQAEQEADRAFNRAAERNVVTRSMGTGAQASLRDNWTWELEDIQKLAAERPDLVVPNTKAINELVRREKVRRIPGLRIFNDRKTVVR